MAKFTLRKMHLVHKDGTKDYHLVWITNESNGNTVLARRWGPVGRTGQNKYTKFSHPRPAAKYGQKIIDDKSGTRGYSIEEDSTNQFADFSDALASLHTPRITLPSEMTSHLTGKSDDYEDITAPDEPEIEYLTPVKEPEPPKIPEMYGSW